MGRGYRIAREAFDTFNAADGWAISSHIALSALMALFPFLIVVTALAGFFGMGVAFLWYWPVLLALVSQAAPKQVTARLMGSAYLSLFLGTVIMGWVGGFYDQMSPIAFWTLDAAISVVGGLAVLAIARPVMRVLSS